MSNTRIQNTGVAGVQELQNADRAARPFIVRAGPLIRKEFTSGSFERLNPLVLQDLDRQAFYPWIPDS
jgi:hypothetical protein